MAGRVTIKDVAREADVSIKTVSNVLNDTGSMRPETRRRVEETMRRLGYTVNVSARAMRGRGTRLIGLGIFGFSQPFAPYLADVVIEHAKQRQYGVIINTYGAGGERVAGIVDDIYRLGADGWLFFTERPLRGEGEVLEQPYPVVLLGDYLSYGKSDWVTMPNAQAMENVVDRLLDGGCSCIALLGAPQASLDVAMAADEGTEMLRMQGYVSSLRSHGVEIDMRMVRPLTSMGSDGGVRAVDEMLDEGIRPDAVVCMTDAVALGALHELQRRGLRVPEDVQVVGFDNVPEARYAVPSLTTVDPHIVDYGRKAVDMLIGRIEGYEGPARTYHSMCTLVERASTLPLAR